MSTFNGQMPEFPDIRVDHFRHVEGVRPPLAAFLSHIHSDHLIGLETLKSPLELLLRLERYPHRINFQKGILEARKQHYKHLKSLLKPIPLETPTVIELAPENEIQVTLFDANHCTGAVMFLFEGNGRAILYTGDTRAEPWFVNALIRSPYLIQYSSGLNSLDCIYLDTSFTEDLQFRSKAEGLSELLRKVTKYPPDTKFHFTAWTFGYEEVWMALSKALNTQIHVDSYKMRLYKALRGEGKDHSGPFISPEGPFLTGYKCGNSLHPGCLTLDQNVRLHSCEKGTSCSGIDQDTVCIRPIITRTSSGVEIGEIGIGGGSGDLKQFPELELSTESAVQQLTEIFQKSDPNMLAEVEGELVKCLRSARKTISLDDLGLDREEHELSLGDLAQLLAKVFRRKHEHSGLLDKFDQREDDKKDNGIHNIPRIITFPYSRHSSYEELCHLVQSFRPKDVYPCTVDERAWHVGASVKSLFGRICSGEEFRHDIEMFQKFNDRVDENPGHRRTSQVTDTSADASSEDGISNRLGQQALGNEKGVHLSDLLAKYPEADIATVGETVGDFSRAKRYQSRQSLGEEYQCKASGWELYTRTGQCARCASGYNSSLDADNDRKRKREQQGKVSVSARTSQFKQSDAESLPISQNFLDPHLNGTCAYVAEPRNTNAKHDLDGLNSDSNASDILHFADAEAVNLYTIEENDYNMAKRSKISWVNRDFKSVSTISEIDASSSIILDTDRVPPDSTVDISEELDDTLQGTNTSLLKSQSELLPQHAILEKGARDSNEHLDRQDVREYHDISLISAGDNHSTTEIEF